MLWIAPLAASALIASLIGLWASRAGTPTIAEVPPVADPPSVVTSAPPRPLTAAVGEAAEATLAIARRTSGPAARLGRDVLDSAATLVAASEVPPPKAPAVEATANRAARTLGDRIGDGVRPLARPTRSAFGFLLPRLSRAEPLPAATPERGA